MLTPIKMPVSGEEPEYGSDSPVVKCEACGKSGPTHLMINLAVCIGSPGHPSLPPFQCPGSQQTAPGPAGAEHWACSPDCWKAVAHACIDEHMHELLKVARAKVGL